MNSPRSGDGIEPITKCVEPTLEPHDDSIVLEPLQAFERRFVARPPVLRCFAGGKFGGQGAFRIHQSQVHVNELSCRLHVSQSCRWLRRVGADSVSWHSL